MKIGIIGLGYVGLPLVIQFAKAGAHVLGIDVDQEKVTALNRGESYIKHIPASEVQAQLDAGQFEATTDCARVGELGAVLICVPTPLDADREPDLSYVLNTGRAIAPHLNKGMVVVLESTTYPGTTEDELRPILERGSGLVAGTDFHLAYSPEREDPGNKNYTTKTIPKVISGVTENCLELTKALYDQIVDQTVSVSSPKVAEMTKILENIHRAVNIGLINELKMVADKMDIDIYEVINAAATKPFGFTPYFPGPGLGGHCIPIDPFYLTWKAKEVGMNTRFIELAGEINTTMPNYVIKKVGEALNGAGKSIKGSRIIIFGLSYKKNVDDLRESPSLELMDRLMDMGADIQYCDPYFDTIPSTRKHQFELSAMPMDEKTLKSADLVLLATDHDDFDYLLILEKAKLIVDTRGRFEPSPKVIKA